MQGIFYGIGVGPGDPELTTMKKQSARSGNVILWQWSYRTRP